MEAMKWASRQELIANPLTMQSAQHLFAARAAACATEHDRTARLQQSLMDISNSKKRGAPSHPFETLQSAAPTRQRVEHFEVPHDMEMTDDAAPTFDITDNFPPHDLVYEDADLVGPSPDLFLQSPPKPPAPPNRTAITPYYNQPWHFYGRYAPPAASPAETQRGDVEFPLLGLHGSVM